MTEQQFQELVADAEAGDAEAQLELGYYYSEEAERKLEMYFGLPSGSPNMRAPYNIDEKNPIRQSAYEDRKRAFGWFEKSAAQGNAEAIYQLSVCYFNGNGTPIYEQKAYELLQRAADMGLLEAQYDLGMMYLNPKSVDGKPLPQDSVRAVEWLTKAAEQDDSFAQFQLGLYYEEKGSKELALEWYGRAAELGDVRACDALDRLAAEK